MEILIIAALSVALVFALSSPTSTPETGLAKPPKTIKAGDHKLTSAWIDDLADAVLNDSRIQAAMIEIEEAEDFEATLPAREAIFMIIPHHGITADLRRHLIAETVKSVRRKRQPLRVVK